MVRHVINEIICYMGHKTTKHGSVMTLIAKNSVFLILIKLVFNTLLSNAPFLYPRKI